MNKFTSSLVTCGVMALMAMAATPAMAQQKRVSPHETISTVIDGNRVTIVYGRPYSKDPKSGEIRKIWGTLIPFGKIWRMGSDEATLLITQQPLMIGETLVPAGAYTLFLLPAEDGTAKFVISKQLGQWGLQYDQKQDFARVDIKSEPAAVPTDEFTMAVEKNPAGGGFIKFMWENTQFAVPFTVKKAPAPTT